MTVTYDPRCYDLAELFLEDEKHLGSEDNIEELAAVIQTTIENFIYYKNAEMVEAEGKPYRDPDHALEDRRERDRERAAEPWVDAHD